MRILIASKRAPGATGRVDGGVQTWVTTVAHELRRLGHAVTVWGKERGMLRSSPKHFDLGIFANAAHSSALAGYCARTVLVSHGIVDDENPADGFSRVFFTSEEVRDHWQGVGDVIRQPIDLDFWHPSRGHRAVVRFANRGGLEWLPGVAASLGLPFVHVRDATSEQARTLLQGAAVVLASGRAAVEAAACGSPVVICDHRPYQSPLLAAFGPGQMERNYSGRGGIAPTPETVRDAIGSALLYGSDIDHVRRHHDVRRIVGQLLK